MKENNSNSFSLLGGNIMKKMLFVLASVALLVFAFSAVAGAKYAGYMLDGAAINSSTPSKAPGYLSWNGAKALMTKNNTAGDLTNLGVDAATQSLVLSTPHGGYITTTTKCAVCHSAHRAVGATQSDGVTPAVGTIKNQFLTFGDDSCVACHTYWGAAQTANLKVEWSNPADGGASGPHGSGGCTNPCHAAGVHGSTGSQYWGMNAYMLGGINDQQITDELPLQQARATDASQVMTDNSATAGINWFISGGTVNTAVGGMPSGLTSATYAAGRSLLTGYTCSRPGCHVNSVFANMTWGQTYARRQLAPSGSDTTTAFMATTGHTSAPGIGHAGNSGCGPCHPGGYSGGYRYDTTQLNSPQAISNSTAYGCDQCHDAVGQLSNSTAFPHANRGIKIFEWTKNGAMSLVSDRIGTSVGAGNIWMYAGNIASTGGNNTTLVDKSFTLLTDAVSSGGQLGNFEDGFCLKCHVPIDSTSAKVYGVAPSVSTTTTATLRATTHGWSQTLPNATVPTAINQMGAYHGNQYKNAGATPQNLIHLWK